MSSNDTEYVTTYRPSLLEPVCRKEQRAALGITDPLPFHGTDLWNAYEFTWLNGKGRPEVAQLSLEVPSRSVNMIESKSLKLYLGSYANTRFSDRAEVACRLETDLTLVAQAPVSVALHTPEQVEQTGIGSMDGQTLDALDIGVEEFSWDPEHLSVESQNLVKESLYTHLFKSRCPLTGQPDHASILIHYSGKRISHEGLLRYLISYRDHADFAEQVAERIYMDIANRCQPDGLNVHAHFSRRGGIDIIPFRSREETPSSVVRSWRQ